MINLARTFGHRAVPSPAPTATDHTDERIRALEQREAMLAAREAEVTARERRLLEAETALSQLAVTAPSQPAPSRDFSDRIGAVDLSVAPKTRAESRARAELVLAVGRKWGAHVLATPVPELDPAAREALQLLEQRQQAAQGERTERDRRAKEQAEAGVALGHRHGSKVLVPQSDS
jgi:hypothetical protein